MEFKAFKRSAIVAALLLAGCNLFNPSGTGETADNSQSSAASGEEMFRNKDYAGAMVAFKKAISQDSNNSLAYYGYAKASVRFYNLNSSTILRDLDSTQNGGGIAFLNHPDSILTNHLQATSKVIRVLKILSERDTLTRWYNYMLDSAHTGGGDTLHAKRIAFIRAYLAKADSGKPGYRSRSKFPLSDFAMPYDKVLVDYAAFSLVYTLTRLYDLDQNDTIDSHDAIMKKLKFNKAGGEGMNLDSLGSIQEDLVNDPQSKTDLNNLIQNVKSGLNSTSDLLSLLGVGGDNGSKDSGSSSGAASGNVDSVISSLGDAIVFYQFGDGKDNDGDGCIDEELMDSQDNDNDGFVDEDTKVIAKADSLTAFDLIDNDHNGLRDGLDLRENKVRIGATPYRLGFVQDFETLNGANSFIKIKKGDENVNFRIRIQSDSLTLKSALQLSSGPLKLKLDSAKSQIGGCWRNY